MSKPIGYCGVGTEDQHAQLQSDAPEVAGCVTISTGAETGCCPTGVDPVGRMRRPQRQKLSTPSQATPDERWA
jgi:hypothetical protein